MHILKTCAVVLSGILFLSCSPKGAVTPEMAFLMLRDAYNSNDSESFSSHLSRDAMMKIRYILGKIKTMDSTQCGKIASELGTDCNALKNLTPEGYISLQFALDRKPGNTTYKTVLQSEIAGKKTISNRCILRMTNGMDITFVKEGPYWKLDLRDF